MKRIAFSTLALALVAGTSQAQPPGGGGRQSAGAQDMVDRMLSFDEDDDGKLSKSEVPERLQGMFSRADKNNDGFLTKDEISADLGSRSGRGGAGGGRGEGGRGEGGPGGGRGGFGGQGGGRGGFGGQGGQGGGRGGFGGQAGGRGGFGQRGGLPPNPLMLALDKDEDGVLSAEEISNAVAALKKLDKDGNGKLDEEELRPTPPEGGRGGREGGRGGFGGPGGGPGGPGGGQGPGGGMGPGGPGGGRGQGGSPVEFLLERFDANKDGKLSGDEIPERMQDRLTDLDKNEDKAIDRSELEAMMEQFGNRGGRGQGGPGGGRGFGGRGPGGQGGQGGGERRRPPIDD